MSGGASGAARTTVPLMPWKGALSRPNTSGRPTKKTVAPVSSSRYSRGAFAPDAAATTLAESNRRDWRKRYAALRSRGWRPWAAEGVPLPDTLRRPIVRCTDAMPIPFATSTRRWSFFAKAVCSREHGLALLRYSDMTVPGVPGAVQSSGELGGALICLGGRAEPASYPVEGSRISVGSVADSEAGDSASVPILSSIGNPDLLF